MALTAAPALADLTCGSAPLAPAVPGSADLAGKTTDEAHQIALGALKSVKAYQGSLTTFRQCLKSQSDGYQAAVDAAKAKGDKTEAAKVQQQLDDANKIFDKSIDTETQVVNDYMTLHNAYCAMGTGLTGCSK